MRREKKDMVAGVGLSVRGEPQPSGKDEGSEEEKENRNRYKD